MYHNFTEQKQLIPALYKPRLPSAVLDTTFFTGNDSSGPLHVYCFNRKFGTGMGLVYDVQCRRALP